MRSKARLCVVISIVSLALATAAIAPRAEARKASPAPKARVQKLKPAQESAAVKAARKLGTASKNPAYKLADGLIYIDVKNGKGAPAKAGQTVEVHYTGWLVNGTKFDSSRDRGTPFSFPLGAGRVIKGWDEGVAGMKPGGVRKLIVPPELGYGSRPVGPIPANSTLIFEVQFLKAL